MFNNRRKSANYTIDPKAQLRFAKPFGILVLVSFLAINMIFWQVLGSRNKLSASASPESLAAMDAMMRSLVTWASAGMVVIGILALALWIVYSHRIFGPLVPIRRQVQSLIDGKYDYVIQLRKNDEMNELAEDLNKLAERLKSR